MNEESFCCCCCDDDDDGDDNSGDVDDVVDAVGFISVGSTGEIPVDESGGDDFVGGGFSAFVGDACRGNSGNADDMEEGFTCVPVTTTVPSVASVVTVVTLEGLVPGAGFVMIVGMDVSTVGVEMGVATASMLRDMSWRIWSSPARSIACIKGALALSEEALAVESVGSFGAILGE